MDVVVTALRSRTILVALGLVTLLVGAIGALSWTLIPVRVDGQVRSIEGAEEGPAFRVLTMDDGRNLTVDASLIRRLGGQDLPDHRITKARGERHIQVGNRSVSLGLSAEFWKTEAMLALVVLLALWRHRVRGRGPV